MPLEVSTAFEISLKLDILPQFPDETRLQAGPGADRSGAPAPILPALAFRSRPPGPGAFPPGGMGLPGVRKPLPSPVRKV